MNDQHGIAEDLSEAVDELHASLTRAAEATARIKSILPSVGRISSVFDELESIIESGRRSAVLGSGDRPKGPAATPERQAGVTSGAMPQRAEAKATAEWAATPAAQPTKAVPLMRAEAAGTPEPQPWPSSTRDAAVPAPAALSHAPAAFAAPSSFTAPAPAAATPEKGEGPRIRAVPAANEPLTSFRLEFESSPGPLDLRAVDEAISEHPDVRDVALLDYDGRRATLKVWIIATASVAEVQQALTSSAAQLAGPGGDISIIALEDVA
jgi:hypothetical protein